MTFTLFPKPPQEKASSKLTLDTISGLLRSQKFIKSSYKRSKKFFFCKLDRKRNPVSPVFILFVHIPLKSAFPFQNGVPFC